MKIFARMLAGTALAVLISVGAAGSALGQDTIEIRADGPDVTDNAAGADNVRVELNPGRQQANAAQGTGNQEIRRAPRQDREQNRDRNRDRAGRNSGGEAAEPAPVEAAPAEAAAAESQVAPQAAPASGSETRPVQLPATGVGMVNAVPGALALLGGGAAAAAWLVRRRR